MKMIYNGTPIKSLNIKHFEVSTNDCTMKASDLQAGVTGVARGKKIVGTGKCFSFAMYGGCPSNIAIPVPTSEINTILISAENYLVKMTNNVLGLRKLDFSIPQKVAIVTIDDSEYPINIQIENDMLTVSCNKSITLQILFGKDEYI